MHWTLAIAMGLVCAVAGRVVLAQTVHDGVYTVEQARRGESAYAKQCASCHLEDLSGSDRGPSLAGDSFLNVWTERSVGDLFDRIDKTMPLDLPGSLSADVTRDIVAFLLRANDFRAGTRELPSDLSVLNGIRISRKS